MSKIKEKVMDPKKLSLLTVTWPIFLEMLMLMLLGNVDVLMLSQYSDDAVAAVGVSNQLLGMSITMFGFVSAGAAVIISQYIGAKKTEDAKRVSLVAILSALVFGLIVSIGFVLFRFPLLRLILSEAYLLPWASTMVLIVGGFIFIQAILLTAGAILRSYGYTRDMLFVTFIMNIFNALGNVLVIFGLFGLPVFGVPGVAVVTAFSKFLGLSIAFYLLNKRIPGIFKSISRKAKFPFHYIKSILKIGIPAAGEGLSFQGYQMVMISLIGTLGTTAVTTKIYTRSINFFIILSAISIANGSAIIIGQLMGAKEYDEIYKRCLRYLRYSIIASGVGAILLFLFYRPILGLFTNNEEIFEIASILFFLGIILEPGRAFNITLIMGGLRATGDVKFPVYMGIIFQWGVGVFLGYLFGIVFGWGLIGIMVAALLDEWIRGIIMLFRWRSRVWQKMSVVIET